MSNKNTKTIPTEQGEYKVGNKKPPKHTQFGQPNGNPRHNGAWKKEDTPRFKLEKMMNLNEVELLKIHSDITAPYFERKLAKAINSGNWKEIREMIHEVYGLPKQSIDTKQDITVRGVSFIKEE